jgi:acyl carrier protein
MIMTFEKVKDIIVEELGVEEDQVTLEADLNDDLGADSLDAVELIMALEDAFDIKVSDDAAQGFKTVQQIVEFIDGLK